VTERELLTSLPDLYRFATASARAVVTSDNLGSATELAGFAFALRNTPLGAIDFVTAPHVSAGDGANVLFAPEAKTWWDALAEDRPLPTASPDPTDDAAPPSATPTQLSTSPSPSPPSG
jgi:hypothetical protein